MIRQVATVAVYVADQEKAKAFWRDKVGFEVRGEQSMGKIGSWLEVAPKGAQSCLVLYPQAAMDDWRERKPSIQPVSEPCFERVHRETSLRQGAWGMFPQRQNLPRAGGWD